MSALEAPELRGPDRRADLETVIDLARRAFEAKDKAVRDTPGVVVDPAVPILYFGDRASYEDSPIRVITVGLNPSREEFPTSDPFCRFRDSSGLRDLQPARYFRSLDRYFVDRPYRSWFSSFEPILNGLDVSYYPGRSGIALHTDLCSPVATDPTWSRLDADTRAQLVEDGRPLWHNLVRYLQPHVILVSVARRHLGGISLPSVGRVAEVYRIERSRPFVVTAWNVELAADFKALMVFGRAAQKPFGTVGKSDKVRIGETILAALANSR